MTHRSLHRRLDSLQGSTSDLTMRNAIDRLPQETREDWLDRTSARLDGRRYACSAVNAHGETYAQWESRRRLKLNAFGGHHESN